MNKVLEDATLTGVVVLNYDTCRQRRLFVDFPGFALPMLQPVVAGNPQPQSAGNSPPRCRPLPGWGAPPGAFKKNPEPTSIRAHLDITGFRCRKILRGGGYIVEFLQSTLQDFGVQKNP
jgi:hypothetical protein